MTTLAAFFFLCHTSRFFVDIGLEFKYWFASRLALYLARILHQFVHKLNLELQSLVSQIVIPSVHLSASLTCAEKQEEGEKCIKNFFFANLLALIIYTNRRSAKFVFSFLISRSRFNIARVWVQTKAKQHGTKSTKSLVVDSQLMWRLNIEIQCLICIPLNELIWKTRKK